MITSLMNLDRFLLRFFGLENIPSNNRLVFLGRRKYNLHDFVFTFTFLIVYSTISFDILGQSRAAALAAVLLYPPLNAPTKIQ